MRPPRFFALLMLGGLALTACGPRDAAYDPTARYALSGLLVPPDVVRGPSHTALENGIYYAVARGRDTQLCCWIARHATPLVAKRRASNTLLVGIYIPNDPVFREGKQRMSVHFQGFRATTRVGGLTPGFHENRIPVPGVLQAKTGKVRIGFDFDFDFVPEPKSAGGKGDHYAALLVSAYFE